MVQSSGFMFTSKLTAGPVNNNDTTAIMTPDASNPDVDKVNWEVVANGKVYVDPAVSVGFGSNFINITNRTGITWPQHSEVVLCTPSVQKALDEAVAANTANIAKHDTRITALDEAVAANTADIAKHDTRITALEDAVSATNPDTLPV